MSLGVTNENESKIRLLSTAEVGFNLCIEQWDNEDLERSVHNGDITFTWLHGVRIQSASNGLSITKCQIIWKAHSDLFDKVH